MKSQQPDYGKNRTTCELPDRDRWINNYLLHTLSDKEIVEFEDHLWTCETCADEIRVLQEIQPVVAQNPALRTEIPSLNTSVSLYINQRLIWKVAALIAFGLALGFYIFTGSDAPLSPSGSIARMEPSANFEGLLERNWRSGISNISPADSSSFSSKIVFSWDDPHSEKLALTVYDNHDQIRFERKKIQSPQEVDIQKYGLESGLYYWKLDAESGIRHVGKLFIVEQ